MSSEEELCSLLQRVRENFGEINTVIHASGVLCDALLLKQSAETFVKVFHPKAIGAWYLHKHTLVDTIRNFVVYSSIMALTGNVGQMNYSAANSYLDSLVQFRRSMKLPGIAV